MDESHESSFSDQPCGELDSNEIMTGEQQGEKALKKRQLLLLVLNAFLGSFIIGYTLTVTNISYKFLYLEDDNTNDHDVELEQAILTAMVPVSGSITAFVIGSKVFVIGRRTKLIVADAITIIGSIIICVSGINIYLYSAAMFLLGIGVGINFITIPTYLIEYSSCQYGNGRLLGFHQFCIVSGIATSYIWGVIFSSDNASNNQWFKWVIYSIPLGFAVIRSSCLICVFNKDTPFFYLLNGYKKQAQTTLLLFFTHAESNKLLEFFEVKRARQLEESSKLVDMLKVRYRRRMAIGSMLNFFCYSSGVFSILLFPYETLNKIKIDNANMLRTLILGITLLFAQFFQAFFAQILGRKTSLLIGQALYIAGFTGIIISHNLTDISYQLNIIVFFECVVCVGFTFESSVIHILLNEILPERGIASVQFISLISVVIGAVIYPALRQNDLMLMNIFSLCLCIIGFLALYKYVKETKGLTNYEIEKVYTGNFQGILNQSNGTITQNKFNEIDEKMRRK